jgi:hypothetical protein
MCVRLAGSISSKLLQAHLNYVHTHSEGIKGVDGRCLANLTWALAKLDLSSDDSALTTELALMVAPFIIRTLDTSSPQVGVGVRCYSFLTAHGAPGHSGWCCVNLWSVISQYSQCYKCMLPPVCCAGSGQYAVELCQVACSTARCGVCSCAQDHRPAGAAVPPA